MSQVKSAQHLNLILLSLMLGAGLLIFAWPATQLDQTLIAPYFDTQTGFYLQHNLFLTRYMHNGLRAVMEVLALLTLLTGISAQQITKLRPLQKPLLWTFCAMLLSVLAVITLKHFSIHACPWDLAEYGGNLPLLQLFDTLPPNTAAGACFPAAHAASGFALMAFYFGFIHHAPKFAKYMLALGLVMGFVMGWIQMMRGAHFMSHTLWSCWISLCVQYALYLAWPPNTPQLRPLVAIKCWLVRCEHARF